MSMEITAFTTSLCAGYSLAGLISFVKSDVWDHKNHSQELLQNKIRHDNLLRGEGEST